MLDAHNYTELPAHNCYTPDPSMHSPTSNDSPNYPPHIQWNASHWLLSVQAFRIHPKSSPAAKLDKGLHYPSSCKPQDQLQLL